MAYIVQTITIGPALILPCLAPGDSGQQEPQSPVVACGALLQHVRRDPVVIKSVRACQVKLGGMKIARGRVHAQGVALAGRRLLGGADGSGIEEQA